MSVVIESYRKSITRLCELASRVPDPRQKRGMRHKIEVILVIFVLALLCVHAHFLFLGAALVPAKIFVL